MNHVIRAVRAEDWRQVREFRLRALQDPVAPLAFLETYEQAVEQPDAFWQDRAEGIRRPGVLARQFVAEAEDGTWSGTVAMMVEEPGHVDFSQITVEERQGHLIGVFVLPEHRGTGLLRRLVDTALEWAWTQEGPPLRRARLFVHEDNHRARAAYRKLGFEPTGRLVPLVSDPSAKEVELALPRPAATSG